MIRSRLVQNMTALIDDLTTYCWEFQVQFWSSQELKNNINSLMIIVIKLLTRC